MKMSTNKWQQNIEMTAVVCFNVKSKIHKQFKNFILFGLKRGE